MDSFIFYSCASLLSSFRHKVVVNAEPTIDTINKDHIETCLSCHQIIAIGGGSTIDTAKLIKARISLGDSFVDLGYGLAGEEWALDLLGGPILVAIPTLPGSGSEASRYAVYYDKSNHKSVIRSWSLQPDLCILDPMLVSSATEEQLVTGCFDIFVHAFETFHSKTERETMVLMLSGSILEKLTDIMHWHLQDPKKNFLSNRIEDLQLMSYLGGSSISNVRTGILHCLGEAASSFMAISHPISLALFYKAAWSRHRHVNIEQTSTTMTSQEVECYITLWDKIFDVHSINRTIEKFAASLAQYQEDLVDIAIRDRTLMAKEDPFSPLSRADVLQIVDEAFAL